MKIKYSEEQLEQDHGPFQSGLWVLTRTVTEVIAAFPSRQSLHDHVKSVGIDLKEEIIKYEELNGYEHSTLTLGQIEQIECEKRSKETIEQCKLDPNYGRH